MLAASFYCLGLVLPARPPCAAAALRVAYPPRATAAEPLGVGQPVPPSVLMKLGGTGGRAVVCFILEDRGSACGKQLRTLAERADSFAARGCQVVAVRPPSGVAEGIAEQYPSLGFVEDTNDGLRQQLGMPFGGGGGGLFGGGRGNKRTTYVLSASGVVAEVITERTGATEHAVQERALTLTLALTLALALAVQALRALRELEEAEAAEAAAAADVPSGEALRQLFVDSSGEETAEALKSQATARAAARSAALREQAMFAKANWKAKFGGGFAAVGAGSRDGKALAKEAAIAGQAWLGLGLGLGVGG